MGIGTIAIICFIGIYGLHELAQIGKELQKQEIDDEAKKRQDLLEEQKLKNEHIALINEHNKNLKISESISNVESSRSFLTTNQVLVGLILILILTVATVFYFKMLYLN